MKRGLGILVLFLLVGCGGGSAMETVYYTLAYPAPQGPAQPQVDAILRIEPVAAAVEAVGRDMLRQDGDYRRQAYHYHRWQQAPADMVQDLIIRDFRDAGLVKAVLSPDEIGSAHYALNARVEAFRLGEDQGKPKAMLTVTVTVTDIRSRNATTGVILQKTYRMLEPLRSSGPDALAAGMSVAMSNFSSALRRDMVEAMRK